MSIDTETIETAAGTYRVEWEYDETADKPFNEGFGLVVNVGRFHHRPRVETLGDPGTVPNEALWAVGQDRDNMWEWENRSGAALVRLLRLKGYKGVTLIDESFRPVEASTDRFDSFYGVTWAPEDATDPDVYTRANLEDWQAWVNGDVFGWTLYAPDGSHVDSVWGYYGFTREYEYTLSEATATAQYDAEQRIEQANANGAGFVGLI